MLWFLGCVATILCHVSSASATCPFNIATFQRGMASSYLSSQVGAFETIHWILLIISDPITPSHILCQ